MSRPTRIGMVQLHGSDLAPMRGARRGRVPRPNAPLTITLHLRSRTAGPGVLEQTLDDIIAGRRAPLSREEFTAEFGASRRDVAAVRRFAAAHGLRMRNVSLGRRTVHITGPASRLAQVFAVNRVQYRLGDTAWNSYTGHVYLPAELAEYVAGVFGFDERPDLARRGGTEMAARTREPHVSYTAPEVAELYRFPHELDGQDQAIGVIALGGGYLASDLRTYFRALHLPMPRIRARAIDGTRNAPRGETAQYDGEITGDIETVAAIVPRARITVYFAPNTARGFFEAVATAVHDRRERNTVISISWGQAEVHWHRSTLRAFNQLLLEAAVLGVTVCCSSGDYGAFADLRDHKAHVNFPASSPYVLACGGTTLIGAGKRIESERVWCNTTGASGGGVSTLFPRPHWQRGVRVPRAPDGHAGRGVPDVASNADPLTGYRVFVHGRWVVGAGTSASAPLWAGLIARINQHCGAPIGLPTPYLYRQFAQLVRAGAVVPVTKGNNGLYRARTGWSCCTGVGTPRGTKLVRAFGRHHGRTRGSAMHSTKRATT